MAAPAYSPYSVNDIVALARHASMSSTYKPALLKALIRILRRGPRREIALGEIGAEFVEMYWVQTVAFRLRQAATITAEPEVVRGIRRASELSRARRLDDLSVEARHRLDAEMAKVLTINVFDRFHRSKPLAMPTLYDWKPGDNCIRLGDSAISFFSKSAPSRRIRRREPGVFPSASTVLGSSPSANAARLAKGSH